MQDQETPYGSDDDLFADLDVETVNEPFIPRPEQIQQTFRRYQREMFRVDICHVTRAGQYMSASHLNKLG